MREACTPQPVTEAEAVEIMKSANGNGVILHAETIELAYARLAEHADLVRKGKP